MALTHEAEKKDGNWPSIGNVLSRWDIHVYYNPDDPEDVKSATEFREELKTAFPELPVYPLVDEAVGPHPQAMFESHMTNSEQFSRVVPWLCLHHRHHSVLIHPLHFDEMKNGLDHTQYPLWLGPRLQIVTECFTENGAPV